MSLEGLKDIVLNYVTKEYLEDDSETLTYDSPLISGGIVDSFSMVSLKRFLERKYSIRIPDADASPQAFDNVSSIAALVTRIQQKG